MAIKPILFNTEMVRAILAGRKTVTRRRIKFLGFKNPNWPGYVKDGLMLYNGTNEPCIKPCQYRLGDILYVRETWAPMYPDNESTEICAYLYKADRQKYGDEYKKEYDLQYPDGKDYTWDGIWRPSIHMPKEAARIWLRVTDVRVEQLQKMWASDTGKEGLLFDRPYTAEEMLKKFAELWDSTIKKSDLDRYGWDANPWVWVIEFEQCEKPKETKCGIVNQHPTVNQWIPVSERLPEECTEVLVSVKEIDGDCYTRTSWLQDNQWIIKKTSLKPTVIAWHPLPEPYRGE